MDLDRLGLWPARVLWLVAPLAIGPALNGALDDVGDGAALVLEIALWSAWFIVLVATLAPNTLSLTVARIAGPTTAVATLLAAVAADGLTGATSLAIGTAAVFTALVMLPVFGDRMINGSAYGSERRMALRPPAVVMVGPLQAAWLVACVGLLAGPLLLATGRTIAAAIAAVIGAVAVWAAGRVLHQLARRWIVFVPAGFVIHDPLALFESILLRRNTINALGPAVQRDGDDGSDEHTLDLSGGALGLALEVEIDAPTPVTIRERREARNAEATNLVFSPTLPGALLKEARIRGIRIGEAAAAS